MCYPEQTSGKPLDQQLRGSTPTSNKNVNTRKNVEEHNEALRLIAKKITKERKAKNKLRELEREWWDTVIQECKGAAEKRDFWSMHVLLRKIGTRKSEPHSGTTVTTEQFKDQFSRVSAGRFERPPAALIDAVREMPDRRLEASVIAANVELNECLTDAEILEAFEQVEDSAPVKDKVRAA